MVKIPQKPRQKTHFQAFIRNCRRDFHNGYSKFQLLICVMAASGNKNNQLMKICTLNYRHWICTYSAISSNLQLACQVWYMSWWERCWPARRFLCNMLTMSLHWLQKSRSEILKKIIWGSLITLIVSKPKTEKFVFHFSGSKQQQL